MHFQNHEYEFELSGIYLRKSPSYIFRDFKLSIKCFFRFPIKHIFSATIFFYDFGFRKQRNKTTNDHSKNFRTYQSHQMVKIEFTLSVILRFSSYFAFFKHIFAIRFVGNVISSKFVLQNVIFCYTYKYVQTAGKITERAVHIIQFCIIYVQSINYQLYFFSFTKQIIKVLLATFIMNFIRVFEIATANGAPGQSYNYICQPIKTL